MKRHLNILKLFWSTALGAEMEYRANFILAALYSGGNLAGSLFGLYLFYRGGYQPGGWRWEEALTVMAFFTILEGFTAACLSPNLNKIVQHVREGTLDFVLLKPVDTQFWLSSRNISIWGAPDILLGVLLLLYAGWKLDFAWTAFAVTVPPLLIALLILYSLWFMLSATSIWFVKVYNVTSVLRSVLQAGRFPVAAYPPAYRFVFTFIVPVTFLTTFPARVMLGTAAWHGYVAASLLAVILFIAARLFWRFALRYYTSASS